MKTTSEEQLRAALYLTLQRLRGRPVASCIRTMQEWERLDRPAFDRLCANRLAETLAHARNRVPLYASEPWRKAPRRSDPSDLRSWPVLERETLQHRAAEMLAQPHPRRLFYRSTSGSTGRALRVAYDPAADAWSRANIYRTMLWFGVPVGAKRLMLAVSHDSALLNWMRSLKAFSARDLSRPRLAEALEYLVRKRPALIWGLPSAILALARYARDVSALPPLVPYVRVYGEVLFPFQREEIERHLGARVIETYGCQELGMVAHECPAGSLHLLAEHVHLEILRDGKPAAPGETGDVVLTALANRAMPLIRYRLGDRAKQSPEPCSCGRPHPVLSSIEGRIGDVLPAADGTPVHGGVLGSGLKKILDKAPAGAVGQVLYEQLDPLSWRILVESGPGFDDRIAAQLVESVRVPFGARCGVEVQRVASIPREPSGKFRYYRTAVKPADYTGGPPTYPAS